MVKCYFLLLNRGVRIFSLTNHFPVLVSAISSSSSINHIVEITYAELSRQINFREGQRLAGLVSNLQDDKYNDSDQ